jgi:hypothetical protein
MLTRAGCDIIEHEARFHHFGQTHHPDLLLQFRKSGSTPLYIHCEVKATSDSKHRAALLRQCRRAAERLGIQSKGPPPPRCVLGVLMCGNRPVVAFCEGWKSQFVSSLLRA